MFVSYITGVPDQWSGERHILHYTSKNLWDWTFVQYLPLSSQRVIDACVFPLYDGWRLWYKDEKDNHTHYADSGDLVHWSYSGIATQDQAQEGPNVFELAGKYWLIADAWEGMAVYSSEDLTHWERQAGYILGNKGLRPGDQNRGHHADVLSIDGNAWIFYFVHPHQSESHEENLHGDISHRRSCLQVAKLIVSDNCLSVIRNEAFDFFLPDI